MGSHDAEPIQPCFTWHVETPGTELSASVGCSARAAATPKKVQQGRTKENLVELSEAQTTFAQWPMQLYSQY